MDRPGLPPPLLVHGPIDAAALLAAVADAAAGGNVLFLGTTRGITDGVVTSRLEYDAHAPMAATLLARLRDEAVHRFGLAGCAVQHRLGAVAVGEASVAIAASAPHRREAFAAAEWLIDRIKREVPIWKCEETPAGGRTWIHPGAAPGAAPADDVPAGGGTTERSAIARPADGRHGGDA